MSNMNLPNPPKHDLGVVTLPHQFKLTQLINDFSSIYGDSLLKHDVKQGILKAQIKYLEEFMYALVLNLPNTDRVESVNK